MRDFTVIYKYELKKIVTRKLVIIATAIVFVAVLSTVCAELFGKYYVEGEVYDTHYHMMVTDREYARTLNDRKINQDLISEMSQAYAKIPSAEREGRYSLTEVYQIYARPYSAIYQFVREVMNMRALPEMMAWEVDEEEVYENYARTAEEERTESYLTENEKAFWREKEAQLEKPFTFGYADGYSRLIHSAYGVCYILLLYIAVCLSDLYTREHSLRTDQLLLCSRLGKGQLYWAKALAGMTFAAGISLIMIAGVMIETLCLYGADGFQVMLQYTVLYYVWPISAGWMMLIMYLLIFCAALVTSIFVMMLSELLHNGTAVLAVIFGMVSATMFFNIPAKHRLAAQIYSYLPSNLLSGDMGGVFSLWLVRTFNGYLAAWQAAPLFYIVFGIVFLLIGRRAYGRYQVSGR